MEENRKEILVTKWLENQLTPAELDEFMKLPEYADYKRIASTAQYFKAPTFQENIVRDAILTRIREKKAPSRFKWVKIAAAIALFLTLGTALLWQLRDTNETFQTEIAETKSIFLPDQSEVILNAASSISYDKSSWIQERTVSLTGEAFFKVRKGSTFSVQSAQGTVAVLGTQFTVKDRGEWYEVRTYEGIVAVQSQETETKLPAGTGLQFINDATTRTTSHSQLRIPSWMEKISTFESVPYVQVVQELERQYNIKVQLEHPNKSTLFTGSFTHTDLNKALQSITVPMRLEYALNGKEVVLSSQ